MGSGAGKYIDTVVGVCGNFYDSLYFLSELNCKSLRVRLGLEILEISEENYKKLSSIIRERE